MMEVEISQDILQTALQRIQGIASSVKIDRIFSYCLIETTEKGIKVNATNKHQTIIGEYDAEITSAGKVCVDARKFYEVTKTLDKGAKISLSLTDDRLLVKCRKTSIHLPVVSPEAFTTLPSFPDSRADLLILKASELSRYLDSVAFAVLPGSNKPLDNLYFAFTNDKVLFVASNGQIFSQVTFTPSKEQLSAAQNFEYLIPKPSLKELQSTLSECEEDEVTVSKSGNHLLFRFPKLLLALVPTNSPYVNYERAYPQGNDVVISLDRETFIHAVSKVSKVLEQTSVMIKLTFTKGQLQLEANSSLGEGDAYDEIDIDYQGEKVVIALNHAFLLETLSHYRSDTVTLKVKDSQTPVLFEDEKRPEYLGILNTMTILSPPSQEENEEEEEDEPF